MHLQPTWIARIRGERNGHPLGRTQKDNVSHFLALAGREQDSSLFIFESLLCCIAYPTEVAYALGNAHEGIVHILLVLEADAAGIAVLA